MEIGESSNISKARGDLARVRQLLLARRLDRLPDATPRLLIVEDDINDRTSYEVEFRHSGFEITFVGTAEEAKALLDPDKFDLVLVNLSLPGAQGPVILEFIESLSKQIPVIVASGLIPVSYPKGFLAVSKPVTLGKIHDAVWKAKAILEPPDGTA